VRVAAARARRLRAAPASQPAVAARRRWLCRVPAAARAPKPKFKRAACSAGPLRRAEPPGGPHSHAGASLTAPATPRRSEAFDLFDTDGSGTIDAKELKVAMRCVPAAHSGPPSRWADAGRVTASAAGARRGFAAACASARPCFHILLLCALRRTRSASPCAGGLPCSVGTHAGGAAPRAARAGVAGAPVLAHAPQPSDSRRALACPAARWASSRRRRR